MRYQIHCLVSKNDAVIIVIEDDCDATMFQCRSAQERFANVHHVECDLDQNSSTAVRHHMSLSAFIHIQAIPFIWRDSSQVFTSMPFHQTSNFEREVLSKPRIPDRVLLTLSEAACLSKAFRADARMMKLLASSFL